MKINKKIIFIIFLIGLVFLYFYIYFYISIPHKKKIYTYLILKKVNQQIQSAWVLYQYYPFAYFYLFKIDVQNHVLEKGEYIPLNENEFFLKKKLKELLKINSFDITLEFDEKSSQKVLALIGGISFFNLYSVSYPLGKVFIDNINYQSFLKGIKKKYYRENMALSIWLNFILDLRKKILENKFYFKQLKKTFNTLDINLNYPSFLRLLNSFLKEENYLIYYDKMNFNQVTYSGQEYFIPLDNGNYDRRKINQTLKDFITENYKYQLFPLPVQVKNATRINRLATKATGVFRYKRLNIVEYLSSSFLLKNSVVVSYFFSPLKEKYVKKTSQVKEVYYLVDYNDEFEFSIFLGDDFYGIKLLKQKK